MKKIAIIAFAFVFIGCTNKIVNPKVVHSIRCWSHITGAVTDPPPPVTYDVQALGPVWLFRQAEGTMLVYHDLNNKLQFIRIMDYEGNTYNECGVN